MAQVLQRNVRGAVTAPPVVLDRRRRRLSTIVARHADRSRPFMVSVHRAGELPVITDDAVRYRTREVALKHGGKTWVETLIGKDDVVAITYLPLGNRAGGGSTGKQIGAAVALIALAIAAPYIAGPAVLGLTGIAATAVSAGIVAGGGFLISRVLQAKANKPPTQDNRPVYGVSGGGNAPRPGDRIPRGYGTFWINPDLSQRDYIVNDGEDQILYKRVTVSLGPVNVKRIDVGSSILWEDGAIRSPFVGAEVEIIQPGATSALVPSSVISSDVVGGNELPRPGGNPDYAGPFPATPAGITAPTIQLDFSLPSGVSSQVTNSQGTQTGPMAWGVQFEYAECDDDNNPVGGWQLLHAEGSYQMSTRAMRFTRLKDVDESKRYIVRAKNLFTDTPPNVHVSQVTNTVMWDALRAHLNDTVVRPHVTEIAMRIRSGKALGITAFSDVLVKASAVIPVFNGSSWVPTETAKAAWAFVDVLHGDAGGVVYGGGVPYSEIDIARAQFYASLGSFDEFHGVIRGPVSVYEAAGTVLGCMRAEPSRIGNAWTITRDEPRAARKHHFTRRQIIRGSSASSFTISPTQGASDVIVEYLADADPRRRRETRVTLGSESLTPRRMNMLGAKDHDHATHIATWVAAAAYYRRERRRFTSELQGRLVNRNDPALVDIWFLTDARTGGLISRTGNTIVLDGPVEVGADTYANFRDRKGREWGPVRVTAGADAATIVLNADDVAAVTDFYGQALDQVLATDDEAMTSIQVGTLTEIREPFIIESAQPQARDRVAIEALVDDPAVWEALAEPLPPEPPTAEVGDTETAAPVLPWLRARSFQKTTSLVMEWAVGRPRDAAQIVVDLSYDDWATSERVSEGLDTSGTYPLQHVEGVTVRVSAYAVSKAGTPGPTVFDAFTTFRPQINRNVADLLVDIENLSEAALLQIGDINKEGEDALSLDMSLGDLTIRDALTLLDAKLEALAGAAATEAGNAYEKRNLIKVAVDDAFAAIETETSARVTALEAAASVSTALGVRLTTAEGTLVGQAAATQSLTTRVTTAEGGITANSAALTSLGVRITTAEGNIAAGATALSSLQTTVTQQGTTISANSSAITALQAVVGDGSLASAVSALTARVTTVEGSVSAVSSSVTALQTTVNGHTATLTTYGGSIDGMKILFGVTGSIDSATGGFVLSGVRRNDGAVSYQVVFDVQGFAITNGQTHKTPFAMVNDRIVIPDLLVTNSLQIADGAVVTSNLAQNSVNLPVQTDFSAVDLATGAGAGSANIPGTSYTFTLTEPAMVDVNAVVNATVSGSGAGTSVSASFFMSLNGNNVNFLARTIPNPNDATHPERLFVNPAGVINISDSANMYLHRYRQRLGAGTYTVMIGGSYASTSGTGKLRLNGGYSVVSLILR